MRFGLAEHNTIEDIRTSGVSIGHRDTDNLVRDNTILRSGKVGILFRDETKEFAAHRNRFEHNRIVDSGPADGIGIDVRGQTECVTLARNEIRETRQPMSRIGIRIGAKAKDIVLSDNRIKGFACGSLRPALTLHVMKGKRGSSGLKQVFSGTIARGSATCPTSLAPPSPTATTLILRAGHVSSVTEEIPAWQARTMAVLSH